MKEKDFKKEIKDFKKYRPHLSSEEFIKAREIYKDLLENTHVSKENERHCYGRIFPVIAIYKAIGNEESDVFERTKKIFFDVEVYPGVGTMRWIFKIPYLYKLVPSIAYKTTRKSYKESEDGFQIDFLETKKDVFRFNIKQCTYFNYCKKFGVEELCDIFCLSDDVVAKVMEPHIAFERGSTLARGGTHCDFCYKIKK